MKCKMRRHCDQSSVDCKRRRHWAQSSMNCKMRRHCDQSSVNCKMWRQDKSRVDCKTRRHCDQLSVNYKIWCHWDQSSVNCKMQRHCDAFSRHFRCQNIDCTPFGNLSLELGGSWLLQIFFTNPLINLTAQLVELFLLRNNLLLIVARLNVKVMTCSYVVHGVCNIVTAVSPCFMRNNNFTFLRKFNQNLLETVEHVRKTESKLISFSPKFW